MVKLFLPHWRLHQDRSLAALDSWGWCRKDAARKVGGTLWPTLTRDGTKMPWALVSPALLRTDLLPSLRAAGASLLSLTAAEASLCYRAGVKRLCSCQLSPVRLAISLLILRRGEDTVPTDPGHQSPLNPYVTFDESGDD